MIAAGSVWAGAEVDSRPKYRDEQTLVGGTVWSQILIPVGIMISNMVGEKINIIVQSYLCISGVVLLFSTGLFLVSKISYK